MSRGVTIGVVVFAILCAALFLIDFVRGRRRRGVIGLILLAAFLLVLHFATDFPSMSERIAFGGGTIPIWVAVIAMSAAVVLGMVGQYVWSKPAAFSWLDFCRPIVVSPLVLLPLIGSLSSGPLEMVQFLSLALLAFQNGFFWQQVLKDAKPLQP